MLLSGFAEGETGDIGILFVLINRLFRSLSLVLALRAILPRHLKLGRAHVWRKIVPVDALMLWRRLRLVVVMVMDNDLLLRGLSSFGIVAIPLRTVRETILVAFLIVFVIVFAVRRSIFRGLLGKVEPASCGFGLCFGQTPTGAPLVSFTLRLQ